MVGAWDGQDLATRAAFTLGSCIGVVADAMPDLAAAVERAATSLGRQKLLFETAMLLAWCCHAVECFCNRATTLAGKSSHQLEAGAKLLLLACGRRWRSLPEVMELKTAVALRVHARLDRE